MNKVPNWNNKINLIRKEKKNKKNINEKSKENITRQAVNENIMENTENQAQGVHNKWNYYFICLWTAQQIIDYRLLKIEIEKQIDKLSGCEQ